jgi:hypothetical protein
MENEEEQVHVQVQAHIHNDEEVQEYSNDGEAGVSSIDPGLSNKLTKVKDSILVRKSSGAKQKQKKFTPAPVMEITEE